MTKQITKNQHIVPQLHLRQFSIPKDINKIETFDCDCLKILTKRPSIKSICSGYFYYALEPGKEDEYSQAVEAAFGNLETWYGNNIKRIENLFLNEERLDDSDRSDEAVIDLMNPKIPENYILRGAWLLKTQIFNLSPRVSIAFSFPFTEEMHGQITYKEISDSKGDIFKQNLYYVNFSHRYVYSLNTQFFEDLIAFERRKI